MSEADDPKNVTAPPEEQPQAIPDTEVEDEEKVGQEAEAEGEQAGESDEEESPDEGEPEKPKRKARPGKYQRKIARLEGEKAALERMLRQGGYRADGQRPEPGTQRRQEADPEPKQEDFKDYGEYLRAVSAREARKAAREVVEGERKSQRETSARNSVQEAARVWQAKVEKATEKYEDFDEVVHESGLPVFDSPTVTQALVESDLGAEIAYHLGHNPQEADRIARLSPVGQAREIGKLEAKLLAKPEPKPKVTNAPDPIKPLGGTGGTGGGRKDPSKMSMSEYVAWREAGGG